MTERERDHEGGSKAVTENEASEGASEDGGIEAVEEEYGGSKVVSERRGREGGELGHEGGSKAV